MQQNISFSEFEGKTNKQKKHFRSNNCFQEMSVCVNRQADFIVHLHTACFFVWEEQHGGGTLKAYSKCPPRNTTTNALNLQSLSPPLKSVHKLFRILYSVIYVH